MSEIKPERTPVEDVLLVIHNNPFLQVSLALPLIAILLYFFGFFCTVGTFFVITISMAFFRVSRLKTAKHEAFEAVEQLSNSEFNDDQLVAWLNLIIAKYWKTCVRAWVVPQIEKTNQIMAEKKPKFMKELKIVQWSLGERPPRINKAFPLPGLSDDKYEIDADIHFVPDASVTVLCQPHDKIKFNLVGCEVKFKGRLRLSFSFNNLFPDYSKVAVSFVGDPIIDVAVKLGPIDLVAIPLVYDIVDNITASNLRPRLVWPARMTFSFGGGTVELASQMNRPITDIIIIHASEKKAPPGYVLLERTSTGLLAANLNRGSKGVPMYICYKRGEGTPVTGLTVFYPGLGESPPPGFTTIEETPGGLPAALNHGNTGPEGYLAFRRSDAEPPITGLTLHNESEYAPLPETHQLLELTPNGRKANFNKKSGGDRIFLAFRGGYKSYFGYNRPYHQDSGGLLRVMLVEGRDLKAADVGGTSDPYCRFYIETENTLGRSKEESGKMSSIIDKTLTPKWEETFIFTATRESILSVNLYDKDLIGKDDFLGRVQISLGNLVVGKPMDQWFTLELVSHGDLRFIITALDFGLPPDTPPTPLVMVPCDKKSANLFLGAVGGAVGAVGGAVGVVGEVGSKVVGGAVGAVKDVGGAVGAVGGAVGGVVGGVVGGAVGGAVGAVKDVGGAVKDVGGAVGEVGSKAVGAVGGAVKDVGGAVKDVGGAVGGAVGAVGGKILGRDHSAKISKKVENTKEAVKVLQEKAGSEPLAYRNRAGYLEAFRRMMGQKKYWAVLDGDQFSTFKSSKHLDKPHSVIALKGATIKFSEDHINTFELQSGHHSVELQAPEDELSAWFFEIQNNINIANSVGSGSGSGWTPKKPKSSSRAEEIPHTPNHDTMKESDEYPSPHGSVHEATEESSADTHSSQKHDHSTAEDSTKVERVPSASSLVSSAEHSSAGARSLSATLEEVTVGGGSMIKGLIGSGKSILPGGKVHAKHRWVVLGSKNLGVFKSKKDDKPKSFVKLAGATLEYDSHKLTFTVSDKHETIVLRASNDAELKDWISAIKHNLSLL